MSYPYGTGHPSYPPYPSGGNPRQNYGFAPQVNPSQQPQPQPTYPGYPSNPVPYPTGGGSGGAYPQSTGFGYPGANPPYPQGVNPPYTSGASQPYPPNPSAQGSAPAYPQFPGNNSGLYPQVNPPTYPSYPTSGYPQTQQQQPYQQTHQQPASGTVNYPQVPTYQQTNYSQSASPQLGHQEKKMGTVREHQPFYPEEDAKVLRKAMKGFGTDEKAIIEILAHRTNAQRQNIYVTYKTHFGRDLIQDLKSELSGRFEDVIVALMTPTYDFLANRIHKAISGMGTDEEAIIDILCGASNQQIREINAAYLRLYRKPMEKDLMSDTSGHFRKLLVSLCQGNRSENPATDPARAAQDAQALYQAGLARWGTDESIFNSVLVSQHFNQLRLVFSEYQRVSGKSLEQSIKSEFSGDTEDGLLAIVKCAQNTPGYFAERLYRSMVGAGTDDRTLIRVVTTRCEIDMVQIKQEFQRMYGKTLESFIAGDTSGDCKKVLLALVQ